jgi:hypoxanthine phosphoribosyltransferase
VPATVLLDADAVAVHVERLAAEIERDHPHGVLLVGVLKGALIFVADLARAMTRVDVELDFMSISRFAPDSGRVKILHDLDTDITDRDVVLVEDMVDTGLTLAYLMGRLAERAPRSLSVCTLLDRPRRRIVPHELRYRGLVLDDEYVLGYGLHTRDLYRNLPFIAAGDRDLVTETPEAYVAQLYGSEMRAAAGEMRAASGKSPAGAGGSVTADRTEKP